MFSVISLPMSVASSENFRTQGQCERMFELLALESEVFARNQYGFEDFFKRFGMQAISGVPMNILERNFLRFIGRHVLDVDCDVENAILQAIKANNFDPDGQKILIDISKIEIRAKGMVRQEVYEVPCGELMKYQRVSGFLKRYGQEMGYEHGLRACHPLTALSFAAISHLRHKQCDNPLEVLFYVDGKLCHLRLDGNNQGARSVRNMEMVRVFSDLEFGDNVVFPAVPASAPRPPVTA